MELLTECSLDSVFVGDDEWRGLVLGWRGGF